MRSCVYVYIVYMYVCRYVCIYIYIRTRQHNALTKVDMLTTDAACSALKHTVVCATYLPRGSWCPKTIPIVAVGVSFLGN